MLKKFNDATPGEIDEAMQIAGKASQEYRKFSLKQRADFMKTIAQDLENADEQLISTAMEETHLPAERLQSEKARTVFQLNSYAEACEKGDWMQVSIDTADQKRKPCKTRHQENDDTTWPCCCFWLQQFSICLFNCRW